MFRKDFAKLNRLVKSVDIELAVGSTCKRILQLIRDEALMGDENSDSQSEDEAGFRNDMKNSVRQGISELIDEQETATVNIASQAFDHIHSSEIIMTIGNSKVVAQFLKEAARLRKFQVIVAETAPLYDGQELALEMASAGISTTVITDSAIFAVMSRVNKVILGTHAGNPCSSSYC